MESYFNILDDIFNQISKFESNSLSIEKYLEGPICQNGFQNAEEECKKRNAKRGLATLCIGGGMGIAMCIERKS